MRRLERRGACGGTSAASASCSGPWPGAASSSSESHGFRTLRHRAEHATASRAWVMKLWLDSSACLSVAAAASCPSTTLRPHCSRCVLPFSSSSFSFYSHDLLGRFFPLTTGAQLFQAHPGRLPPLGPCPVPVGLQPARGLPGLALVPAAAAHGPRPGQGRLLSHRLQPRGRLHLRVLPATERRPQAGGQGACRSCGTTSQAPALCMICMADHLSPPCVLPAGGEHPLHDQRRAVSHPRPVCGPLRQACHGGDAGAAGADPGAPDARALDQPHASGATHRTGTRIQVHHQTPPPRCPSRPPIRI